MRVIGELVRFGLHLRISYMASLQFGQRLELEPNAQSVYTDKGAWRRSGPTPYSVQTMEAMGVSKVTEPRTDKEDQDPQAHYLRTVGPLLWKELQTKQKPETLRSPRTLRMISNCSILPKRVGRVMERN
eukprot:g9341.t1